MALMLRSRSLVNQDWVITPHTQGSLSYYTTYTGQSITSDFGGRSSCTVFNSHSNKLYKTTSAIIKLRKGSNSAQGGPGSYQNTKQFLQIAANDVFILIEGPTTLLSIIFMASQICKYHLEPLLIVADLSRWQPRTKILQEQRNVSLQQ